MIEPKYPLLFSKTPGDRMRTRTGLEIRPGWLHLAEAFCDLAYAIAQIPTLERKVELIQAGTSPLSDEEARKVRAELRRARASLPLVLIKEKFGVMRIQMAYKTRAPIAGREILRARLRAAADMAELISQKTCDCCAKPGTLRQLGGWWVTLCDEHLAMADEQPEALRQAYADERSRLGWVISTDYIID